MAFLFYCCCIRNIYRESLHSCFFFFQLEFLPLSRHVKLFALIRVHRYDPPTLSPSICRVRLTSAGNGRFGRD